MLAYILALAVGSGSLALYTIAFFIPEVHRKSDFIWSGVGLFYALILWVCAGRITGAVLLGQIASVALLGWLGWQTLTLRRSLTPATQQTPLPNPESIAGQTAKVKSVGGGSKFPGKITGLFGKKSVATEKKPTPAIEPPSPPEIAQPVVLTPQETVVEPNSEVNEAWAEEQAAELVETPIQEVVSPVVPPPFSRFEELLELSETPTVELEKPQENLETSVLPETVLTPQSDEETWDEETKLNPVPKVPETQATPPPASTKTAKPSRGFGSLFSSLKNRLGLGGLGKRKSQESSPVAKSPEIVTPEPSGDTETSSSTLPVSESDRTLESELAEVAKEIAAETTAPESVAEVTLPVETIEAEIADTEPTSEAELLVTVDVVELNALTPPVEIELILPIEPLETDETKAVEEVLVVDVTVDLEVKPIEVVEAEVLEGGENSELVPPNLPDDLEAESKTIPGRDIEPEK